MTTKETIEQTAADLGLTMTCEFVPWSRSRNKGEKSPSLNWRVTLRKDDGLTTKAGGRGFEILTTDYSAGCGHCPSYKQGKQTVADAEVVRFECETGRHGFFAGAGPVARPGKPPILPALAGVLASLVLDAEVIDHGTFEEWAESMGYETDSRKAEATYKACLEIGLKLRNALGEDGLRRLRDACQDY